MKKKMFLGANWKMNAVPAGAFEKTSPYFSKGDPQIVVFPMAIDLQNCIRSGNLIVGAQCGRAEANGAFTGDISMQSLKEFGCSYILCGHSEHRRFHRETNEEVGAQFMGAITAGLIPVLCIGETAEERAQGKMNDVLKAQLAFLASQNVTVDQFLIAYEPVWAISGGDPTKPAAGIADAEQVHQFIRSILPKELQSVRILYGGSMKASNAAELLSQPNIDGGLIGGASLKPSEFAGIVEAVKRS